jgi:probable F420-dependent oxidoreductase
VPEIRWGLTVPFPGVALADHPPLFRQAEAEGFDDLWTGETTGPDGFTPLALAAALTERIRLGTGIVNPFTRGPAVLAQHAAALADASNGRFVLGIGSSSNVIVERWNGVPFVKPLSKVREAVEALRPILAGERGPGGFKLETPPAHPIPIVIAALRGKMLGLAAELGDGAFTNFLPLSGAPQVAETFSAPDKELVCRFFCIPQPADEGMGLAKFMFAAYGTVPVYADFFRWLGWGEKLDPMVEAWQGGDRQKALELAPEDLISEIFVFGSPEEHHERLAQFAQAGITTFVLTPITTPDDLPRMIGALARDRAA